jgi:hypothetical protein
MDFAGYQGFLWTAVDRNRVRFAGFEVGNYSSGTFGIK